MKKQLLCGFASLLFASAVHAQSPIIIYNGTEGQLFDGTPFADTATKISEPSWKGNKYWRIQGTSSDSSNYVGLVGNARYGTGSVAEPLDYTGTVASSVLSFKVYTDTTKPGFRIQFTTSTNVQFGYQWDTIPARTDTGFVSIVVPLADFKIVRADTISNSPVTDVELQDASSRIEFLLFARDTSSLAVLGIDDFTIGNAGTLSVYDQDITSSRPVIYPNPCNTGTVHLGEVPRNYSLMNSSGAAMKTGTGNSIDVSTLNPGVYYIKMDANVQKLVIN